MEQHQPSNSPYIESTPPTISQRATHHSNDQHESNEQPSLICGFTSTELINFTIQVAGVIIGAIFGAWAVKSYESSNVANRLAQDSLLESNDANQLAQAALQQSLYANILALINLCLSDLFRDTTYCRALLQATPLASIIQSVIPTLPTISSTPRQDVTRTPPITSATLSSSSNGSTPTGAPPSSRPTSTPSIVSQPTSATRHIGFGALVGIIIGVVVIVAIFCLLLVRYRRTKRSRF